MQAHDITIEWDEGGCYITIDGDSVDPEYQTGRYTWRVEDPEQLYDRVKAAILPWLMERDEALRAYRAHVGAFHCDPDESGGFAIDDGSGYDRSDPKHPEFYSVHVDHYDNREKVQ